jgi:hypothetical protein
VRATADKEEKLEMGTDEYSSANADGVASPSIIPEDNGTGPTDPPTGLGLFLGRSRRLAAIIFPDDRWPGQWRVALPDGTITDHTNLVRAKDAALTRVEGIEAAKTPHKSPLKLLDIFQWSPSPVRFSARRVPKAATRLESSASEVTSSSSYADSRLRRQRESQGSE